ncbi:RagB/SusD family nutrient uptake outer membrane protein [Myroides odoratimimus]|uniref:RagB/SusD family nutrient uptake outer membrane protein n=1 Tax=Myroides odoratimimus TaxID=76832 RepID=UPI00046B0A74|nr:RagB/SusD family nutrient uptake outer membrane protein [Myroides odoratimimus]
MKRNIRKILLSVSILIVGLSITSCSLDTEQSSRVDNEKNPIRTFEELEAGIIGSYTRMTSETYYGRDIIIFSESRTPYCYSEGNSGRFHNVSGFALQVNHAYPADTWRQIYRVISNTNRVLEAEIGGDEGVIDYFKGQGYIIRALAHYDLLRLFGEQYVDNSGLTALGIPYITEFGKTSANVERPTVAINMKSIFDDLDKGIDLMKKAQSNASAKVSKVKINLAAAYGYKSRIALFFAHYNSSLYDDVAENAELAIKEAEKMNVVVASRTGFLDAYTTEGIGSNSIFELAQSGTDNRGTNSLRYIYNTANEVGYGDVRWNALSPIASFFPETESTFNVSDIRRNIIDEVGGVMRNTGKYTKNESNIKMMRIEEMMFNYIESAVKGASKANTATALGYLNEIVENRVLLIDPTIENDLGTPKKYTALDFESVKKERTRELMFEGLGYEDLMRWEGEVRNPRTTSNTNLAGGVLKYGNALTAFPIPLSEINVSKIEQNQAYR